ncbi:hypothetical protein [Enterovirga sp. CN4-39]|uniref:hypothetical protein n=1 Tax=Enterovirga sp. CN4-39 TaxID=3400910 RepID=UPI003C0AED23
MAASSAKVDVKQPHYLAAFDLSAADIATFDAYEAKVLPLLAAHGGELLWRVRSVDRATEYHLLRFASETGLQRYRQDPLRMAAAPLFASSGALASVTEVTLVSSI